MPQADRRMKRERRTLEAMVTLYCQALHGKGKGLCPGCASLLEYSLERLARCPFQERKPACSQCPVHCYRPDMREKVKAVMRHAGPRMIRRHPVLALLHMMDAAGRSRGRTSG